jgi:antitoxin component YwqK of YwqJK toxin-antitoxin module
MSNYLLPDILQYVLNNYLDHQDIEVYNRVFNFEFKIEKYTKIKKRTADGFFMYLKETYLDNQLIKEELLHIKGNKYEEKNFKYGKLDGKYIQYYLNGTINYESIYKNGEMIGSTKKSNSLKQNKCCIIC